MQQDLVPYESLPCPAACTFKSVFDDVALLPFLPPHASFCTCTIPGSRFPFVCSLYFKPPPCAYSPTNDHGLRGVAAVGADRLRIPVTVVLPVV